MDKAHDGHGVANQLAKLEQKARERGWTVVYRLSDNDIGVTRKDPTKPGKYRPGYEEAMRLVDVGAVDAVLCFKWDRFIREPLDLEYLIPRFDKAGVRFTEVDGSIDLGTDSGRLHARILIAVAKAERAPGRDEAAGGQPDWRRAIVDFRVGRTATEPAPEPAGCWPRRSARAGSMRKSTCAGDVGPHPGQIAHRRRIAPGLSRRAIPDYPAAPWPGAAGPAGSNPAPPTP